VCTNVKKSNFYGMDFHVVVAATLASCVTAEYLTGVVAVG
jgi:hypothetical protein